MKRFMSVHEYLDQNCNGIGKGGDDYVSSYVSTAGMIAHDCQADR